MSDFLKQDRLANLGYFAIGKEATRGVPVAPTVAVPLYEENLLTNLNLDMDNPIMGNRFARYFNFKGQRDHKGTLKVLAEPKTLPHFINMILDKGVTSVSGGVYTHPYTLGNQSEASYTIEILKGDILYRYFGVEVGQLSPIFEDNVLKLSLAVSALGQFSIAPIASASGSSANNITLSTEYSDTPNKGIVTGDKLILVKVSAGTSDSYEEVTVSGVNANGTQVSVGSIVGTYTALDYCYIKQQTITPTLGEPLKWSGTQFCFGATAAAALTATHTPVEKGSTFEIMNNFEDESGAKRSGSLDPTALVRAQADVNITIKKSFNDYVDYERFLALRKRSLVIRLFGALISGSDKNELRITVNNMKVKNGPNPLTTGEIIYFEREYSPQYDTSDAQAFDVKVINDVAGTSY
jgi:hypothetical protein